MISDNKLLLSHIDDLINAVKKGRRFVFTPFLSIDQISDVIGYLRNRNIDFCLYGGYEDAERCIVGLGTDSPPENYIFPLSSLEFLLNSNVEITHRHVLGALMSLGIKRECIGDIVFTEDKCVFFVETKIAEYIQLNLFSVSKLRVEVNLSSFDGDLSRSFEECGCIVASMRLDCIISELAHKSRSYACELIERGLVFVDGIQCQKKDKLVDEKSIISIRKVGKFKIDSIDGKTKKDRIKLKILKYI